MMPPRRIPFGLDRLPRTLPPDDPRLPGVTVSADPLRFNTAPLPADAIATGGASHATRLAAMQQILHAACGDYAPQRERFVHAYLAAITAHIDAHQAELAERLKPYQGLYAPQDWLWSALRPLPRAWLPAGDAMAMADVAFWDGTRPIAILLGDVPDVPDAVTCRIAPALLAGPPARLLCALPACFRQFWQSEILPRSPFRRALPDAPANPPSLRGA
jgi:hypothetical protein